MNIFMHLGCIIIVVVIVWMMWMDSSIVSDIFADTNDSCRLTTPAPFMLLEKSIVKIE